MRLARRIGLSGGKVQDLDIRTTSIALTSKAWVTRNNKGTVTENVQGSAASWTKTVDLTKYTKVHFQVTGGSGSRYISVGSVKTNNPGTGEKILDISGISNRTSLTVTVYLYGASASAAGYYPSTNVVNTSITVSKIWASA